MNPDGNPNLERILESAVVSSWDDLMHGAPTGLIHIEYGFAAGGTLHRTIHFSKAARRRSRCGSVRGSPVLSSHFSPGFAPHVGQRTASASFSVTFMPPQCTVANREDGQF